MVASLLDGVSKKPIESLSSSRISSISRRGQRQVSEAFARLVSEERYEG